MQTISQLANGLTIVTAEMPHMTSVSAGIWVAVGSRHEPLEQNGICHFIEHLLFKGTAKRTATEISQAVEGVGGQLNAFTSEEMTCFHARAPYRRFREVLEVLVDMLIHSKFAPRDIVMEREVIKEEIAMYLDEPQQHVQELLNETLWPEQPLGRPITGSPRSLDAIDRQKLLGWLRLHYVAGATLLTVAGNVKHQEVVRTVSTLCRALPRGGKQPFVRAQTQQREPQVRLATRKVEQTQLALGIRTCSRHDARRYPLRLLNTILGENMSSRLFQEIREDRGLAYSIYSTVSFFEDAGDFVIYAGLDTDNLPKVLRLIMKELHSLVRRPVSRRVLQRARDYVLGQMELSLENTESQMNWIGEQWLGYGRLFSPEYVRRRLCRVTAAEMQATAQSFFDASRLSLALVSPLKTVSTVQRCLRF